MEILRSAIEALERDLRSAENPKKDVRKAPKKDMPAGGRPDRR